MLIYILYCDQTKCNQTKPKQNKIFFFCIIGCPGLDDYEYGVVNPPSEWTAQWPFIKPQSSEPRHSFQASPAMRCGLSGNTDSNGVKLHKIIDEMAFDNENFASRFLEGWHQMTTNGYRQGFIVAKISCNSVQSKLLHQSFVICCQCLPIFF